MIKISSLNKKVFKQLKNTKHKDCVIIPKVGHLFNEEEGLIEKVAEISKEWFSKNLEK